jgi:hypothetical protein
MCEAPAKAANRLEPVEVKGGFFQNFSFCS